MKYYEYTLTDKITGRTVAVDQYQNKQGAVQAAHYYSKMLKETVKIDVRPVPAIPGLGR